MNYSVIVIEDNNLICHGLKTLLSRNSAIQDTWIAQSGAEGLQQLEKDTADIAIIDMNLPDMGGIELIQQIHTKWPQTKLMVLTANHDPKMMLQAFTAGINAYCTKNISERIADLVVDVAQGAVWIDPIVSSHALEVLKGHTLAAMQNQTCFKEQFSQRELRILTLLAQGKNNQKIADELHFSVHSVKVYLSKIFEKLNVDDRTQAAVKSIQSKIIPYTLN